MYGYVECTAPSPKEREKEGEALNMLNYNVD